jgi:hypothetical protein
MRDHMNKGQVGFNDKLFSPVKGGTFERSNVFASGSSSQSGMVAGLSSRASSAGSEKALSQPKKKAKTWDKEQQVSKVSSSLVAKVATLGGVCEQLVQRVTDLEQQLTDEEKVTVDKFLQSQNARVPLLNALMFNPADDAINVTLPGDWNVSEVMQAQWLSVHSAFAIVSQMVLAAGGGSPSSLDEVKWAAAVQAKFADLKGSVVFADSDHPDFEIATKFLSKYLNDEQKCVPGVPGELLNDLTKLCKCSLVRIRWLAAQSAFASTKSTLPVADLVKVVPLMLLRVAADQITAPSEHELKVADKQLKATIDTTKVSGMQVPSRG